MLLTATSNTPRLTAPSERGIETRRRLLMDGIRPRLVGFVEWVAAAACVLGALVAGAGLYSEARHVRPVVNVIAEEAQAPIAPANLRPGAISVPELVLPDGKRLVRGESASTLEALGPRAQSEPTAVERASTGQRESRTYRYAGMEFVVVTADQQIVAIYR
jgi:hypothetical protein